MLVKLNEKQNIVEYCGYIRVGGRVIANPDDNLIAASGYKRLVQGEMPEGVSPERLRVSYIEAENEIIRVYTLREDNE